MKISLKNISLFTLAFITFASNNLFGLGDTGKKQKIVKPKIATRRTRSISRYTCLKSHNPASNHRRNF